MLSPKTFYYTKPAKLGTVKIVRIVVESYDASTLFPLINQIILIAGRLLQRLFIIRFCAFSGDEFLLKQNSERNVVFSDSFKLHNYSSLCVRSTS